MVVYYKDNDSPEYHCDSFDDDDMAFIESQSEASYEDSYNFLENQSYEEDSIHGLEDVDELLLPEHELDVDELLLSEHEFSTIALEEEIEEEVYEENWSDIENLNEFDKSEKREIEDEEIQITGKVDRETRAKQIALELIDRHDLGPEYLTLLQQIFVEGGWSVTRSEIEKQIDQGLHLEELALARKVRLFWKESEQYWTTFHRIKSKESPQQASAFYRNMSWKDSLRIVRLFPLLPDIEEVYTFIDEVFGYWYYNDGLNTAFKSFHEFLKHCTGLIHDTLPNNCTYSLFYLLDTIVSVNLGDLYTPTNQKLLSLGLHLNQWPHPQSQLGRLARQVKIF